ncbi:MAG TPA: hypothetical protein VIJ27_03840 [Mucilaginibacter sp.]
MKTTTSILLVLAVLFSACKKNHVNKPQPSISGTWELRATKGGNILPATYPAGNGNLIYFTDASYTYYNSGSLVTQGTFQQTIDNNGAETVTFKSGNFTNEMGVLQLDTLRLKPFNPDISTGYYVRKP